ncbi:DUF3017 domain-containing protein [Corynebacterium sp. TAE3-ERU16]|uniref:DUF3017 domain-containing protein n=1 Tax=Corynebacterium sp. TAE3-ERU16 TaxID=2849493 RepID=UPI001C450809|nr:DUF3017 domain-containing protein [Corynebacterium sp. TAE3-ERU16]MBV7292628.1 DUF3017 domain-containing protein [Corynebacterium sp. TAE3-ERU16]
MGSSYIPGIDNPHDVGLPPSRVPHVIQRAFMALLFAAFLVVIGFALTEHWRRATFLLGCALIWLSVIRVTCDSRTLGVFAVRSRKFDTPFTLLMGGSMAFLAMSVDPLGS